MAMIDYDARPVTPQVRLLGHRASSVGYSIRDFLSRNGVPYEWVDADDAARAEALFPAADRDQFPVCIFPDGVRLAPATVEGVAAGLGMMSAPSLADYDLTIVGAGPAGLAAAVYAASEGLRALTIVRCRPWWSGGDHFHDRELPWFLAGDQWKRVGNAGDRSGQKIRSRNPSRSVALQYHQGRSGISGPPL